MKSATSVLVGLSVFTLGVEGLPKLRHQHAEIQLQNPAESATPETGSGDFPTLPDVSKVLGTAQETMQGLAKQAADLEMRVERTQKEKASKMAEQKAAFEAKLKDQELGNRALVAENKVVVREIGQLQSKSADIRALSKKLADSNKLMGDELQALGAKLGIAGGFVADALMQTGGSNADDLASAQQATPAAAVTSVEREESARAEAPSQQTPLAEVATSAVASDSDAGGADADDQDDEDGQGPVSFLVIDEERVQTPAAEAPQTDADPRELIKVLQRSATELASQEQAGEAQLKAFFVKTFKVGAQRHQALVTQQKTLNATRASLLAVQNKLNTTETHLQTTKSELERRLHGLGLFLQKLAHLALAPEAEAPHLMPGLPTRVLAAAPPPSAVA